jgi:hypothetical protein
MPGPAPKPADQRARRNPTYAMTRLPAEGRKGRAPAWPLAGDLEIETKIFFAEQQLAEQKDELEWATTARARTGIRQKQTRLKKTIAELRALNVFITKTEKTIWAALWKTPQATQWEKRAWYREVALYARHQAKAEAGSIQDSAEARQREDAEAAVGDCRGRGGRLRTAPTVEPQRQEVRRPQGRLVRIRTDSTG